MHEETNGSLVSESWIVCTRLIRIQRHWLVSTQDCRFKSNITTLTEARHGVELAYKLNKKKKCVWLVSCACLIKTVNLDQFRIYGDYFIDV